MQYDSDVVLFGTGVAPLVAARRLLQEGKSVLLLNPDRDYFLEDSELPLDPFSPVDELSPEALKKSGPESMLASLGPEFPGSLEAWPPLPPLAGAKASDGFHDDEAPHVRSRSRLWLSSTKDPSGVSLEKLESLYVEAEDAGFNPAIVEELVALKKFPGVSPRALQNIDVLGLKGLLIPKICDVDVGRFRYGLLEFLRERLPAEKIACSASQVELTPGGIRFHSGGSPHTARIRDGVLVFWTPRMTQWILAQAKKTERKPILPDTVRIWEEWALVSRENVDPGVVGVYGDTWVWGEAEGRPAPEKINRLMVLRGGERFPLQTLIESWANTASSQSFQSLSKLCYGFLRWDRFSVSSLKTRAILEWSPEARQAGGFSLQDGSSAGGTCGAWVCARSDGPLSEVVNAAREACSRV